jgi:phosphoglycolate phosphatase
LLNKKETPSGVSFFNQSRENLMKYTHIIWDFNGTVLDDVSVGMDSTNVLLEKRALAIIGGVDRYREIFGFPVIEYYKTLGFDFSKEDYSDVAIEWVDEYLSRVGEAKLNDGVREMLEKIGERGIKQVLLSATEIGMLKKQLSDLLLLDCFDEIYGLDDIHAHTKIALAEEWRRENPDAVALFVGDTDHDCQAAKAMNADCVLYCGGHQSEARLARLGCPVIKRINDLKDFLSNN